MYLWIGVSGLTGALAVAFGAAAAHGLGSTLPADQVGWVRTGAQYAMVHAPALLAVAWLTAARGGALVAVAGAAFLAGAVLFSGGLWLAGLTGWTGLMPVVPVGGLGYILGWLTLAAVAVRRAG
ncbi:Uncharacterized membrane protein YgdD, TMEM256/DUF423 family [Limimonas halophila]|uniref:Uncharacterized membrane protein YgdD, TMEM256/DUF423 family n=1 Tax=Limimonas halophila TaxID=1082479 RepID=A0A1G7T750_9PROT|nr:DUF423 domain-containing protein [Limimonas halophila]SDG31105.1 Uncharacterized membrane protein YgdD, TMEM256/DUF423 family [Limimonas halophila]